MLKYGVPAWIYLFWVIFYTWRVCGRAALPRTGGWRDPRTTLLLLYLSICGTNYGRYHKWSRQTGPFSGDLYSRISDHDRFYLVRRTPNGNPRVYFRKHNQYGTVVLNLCIIIKATGLAIHLRNWILKPSVIAAGCILAGKIIRTVPINNKFLSFFVCGCVCCLTVLLLVVTMFRNLKWGDLFWRKIQTKKSLQ